jgi:hypothetical protein
MGGSISGWVCCVESRKTAAEDNEEEWSSIDEKVGVTMTDAWEMDETE